MDISPGEDRRPVIVKTYKGTEAAAMQLFQEDAATMAAQRYYPTSQSWAPGSYGCGAFLVALLLCFVVIGFIIFIYMFLVKPDGTLTVTYELRNSPDTSEGQREILEKVCPQCAESVKAAAKICRFCGFQFEQLA